MSLQITQILSLQNEGMNRNSTVNISSLPVSMKSSIVGIQNIEPHAT